MDVKIALLHGNLKEEICITQPNGFKVVGKRCSLEDEEVFVRFEAVSKTII